jgi:predicted phosphodiesterase
MKIRVLSDLHLEFQGWTPPAATADVVVLAGDIHVGIEGLYWARRQFPDTSVVYVPGNHEFYGSDLSEMLAELRAEAHRLGIHLLDGEEIIIDRVRFLGATLWTDFELYGSEPHAVARAMTSAQQGMLDYRVIRRLGSGLLRPEDTRDINRAQVRWLAERLAESSAGPTVVVTHNLPHQQSIHPKYAGDGLNPSFASDLSHLVHAPVSLWIHGHTHESMDYLIDDTRVVCNPRGYLPQEPNPAFQPALVVEIAD